MMMMMQVPQMTQSGDDKDDEDGDRRPSVDCVYLVLQSLGIISGLAIMTVIGLYENRIQYLGTGFGPADD